MRDLGDRLEVFVADFDPQKRECILDFLGVDSPGEANLDLYPVAEIPKPEE